MLENISNGRALLQPRFNNRALNRGLVPILKAFDNRVLNQKPNNRVSQPKKRTSCSQQKGPQLVLLNQKAKA